MWDKKDPAARPGSEPVFTPTAAPDPARTTKSVASIGSSIQIKGELQGDEDLMIDGRVEGKIDLRDHNLSIGPNGKIKADLFGRTITIAGEVAGNAHAAERVEIAPSGRLNGNIQAPRITIADGAHFRGNVDMEQKSASATAKASTREEARGIGLAAQSDAAKSQPRL
jgi:cytoskeletal protein CcmA (bactofilin family)